MPRSGDVSCPSCGSCFNLAKDMATAEDDGTHGKMLGHVQLLHCLGQGAFGAVWKARDTKLDRIYIASDFIDGPSLDDWIKAHPLTVRESVELCATIAESLHHAHEAGVVHRDLKPQNILVRAESSVVSDQWSEKQRLR